MISYKLSEFLFLIWIKILQIVILVFLTTKNTDLIRNVSHIKEDEMLVQKDACYLLDLNFLLPYTLSIKYGI